MKRRPEDLPDFERPPVAEVVFGVQFSLEKPLLTPHLGLYWREIRDEFPEVQEQSPLAPETEEFGQSAVKAAPPMLHFRSGPPLRRCWFLSPGGNRLIQVQEDRFIYNWRKESEQEYPRYESIRNEFLPHWAKFVAFAEGHNLGKARVDQCELTYVNHLPEGSCWNEMSDARKLFSFCSEGGSTGFLPSPETMNWSLHYRMPEDRGRLHVGLSPAIRTRDRKLILQLTLTARGSVTVESQEGLLSWFQVAREWIVKGFEDQVTPSAWDHWGRKSK